MPERGSDHGSARGIIVDLGNRVGELLASKYRLEALLGSGGMGDVYRAVNVPIGRAVAIKVLRAEHAKDAPIVERFLREARAANLVRHPNVVDVLDIGEDGGAPFIVQELLDGEDLAHFAERRGGKLPMEEVIDLLAPVIEAVAEAHHRGVVHRDIKPENVFLVKGLRGPIPKLLDFGISKISAADLRATETGVMMGTPAYMAPEQIEGASEADPRSDVWALGVMMFELIAGRMPFEAKQTMPLFLAIATRDAPTLLEVHADVTPAISRVVERCLRRKRAERYPSANELARDLRHAIEGSELEPTGKHSIPVSALLRAMDAGIPKAARVPSVGGDATTIDVRSDTVPELLSARGLPASALASRLPLAPTEVRPRGSRGSIAVIVGGAVVLASIAAGVAVYFGRRPDPPAGPSFVLVERDPSGTANTITANPSTTAPPEGSVGASGSSHTSASAGPPAVRKGAPATDPLSAALAKNQPEIEACFRDKAADVSGNPDVSVRLTIDREGVVQKAELSPAELAGLPLGQCILGVARRTHFPAQSAPATFRIPLRTRRVP